MSGRSKVFKLTDEAKTHRFARAIGARLDLGDTILLDGPVGAGKTAFARALIQSLLVQQEDIPSPTFTLVQVYDTRVGPLWHADLYRIESISEIEELGLYEAFDTSITIIEWPGSLGTDIPRHALSARFEIAGDELRDITFGWNDARWNWLQDATL